MYKGVHEADRYSDFARQCALVRHFLASEIVEQLDGFSEIAVLGHSPSSSLSFT